MSLTFAELFAGVGGLSMGLEAAGWRSIAHCEIEAFPRQVLAARWPGVRLDGDVADVNGADYRGIMLLSGGSPCQDLSVAGKRKGMTEGSGTRSALFYEQVRVWRESDAPYFLWENVLGAFSSNAGRDFAAVLSTLVGAPLAVPDDGWRGAGVASGPAGVAAWRVLDAQYFGVPQRRRRVFVLCARAGGVDPAEVLALSESVRGDSPTRGAAGEGATADAPAGARGGGERVTVIPIQEIGKRQTGTPMNGVGHGEPGDPMYTLQAGAQHGVIAFDDRNQEASEVHHTLRADGGGSRVSDFVFDARGNGDGKVSSALVGDHMGRVGDYTPVVVSPTLATGAHPGSYNGMDAVPIAEAILTATSLTKRMGDSVRCASQETLPVSSGRPRRLTPLECERLQGWPDGWTDVPDEKGKPASDSARYKACGNGVSSPVAAWIGFRLRDAIEHLNP